MGRHTTLPVRTDETTFHVCIITFASYSLGVVILANIAP